MAEIIYFNNRRIRRPDTLTTSGPWEFRQAAWKTAHFVQMLRPDAFALEEYRGQHPELKGSGPLQLPPHFSLVNGMQSTIRGIFAYRDREDKMRDVYLLAGLIDCMINQINPVLRTALLRDMYKKVFKMKKALGIAWYGPLDHVLLPIDPSLHNVHEYCDALAGARNMKALYEKIREGTTEMFDILSLKYVFYFPNAEA
ncbi:MAG: hypothetical protein WAL98_00785 [Desulfatiglandaceae bacterium]